MNSGHRLWRALRGWLVVLATLAATTATAQPAELRFSVAPYLSPARMDELYGPIAKALSRTLGQPVVFRTSSTFERYYEQLGAGNMDFTLLHAFFYVTAVDQHGYVPIARMNEPFKGVLVVLDQSPVKTLTDLKDKTIATPPEFLPTVHLIRRVMRDQKLDPGKDFTMRSFRSVESCLQQIVIGEAAACICPPFALPGAQAQFKVKFRTVVESQSIPNLSFVASSRLSETDRNRVREAILKLNDSEEGRALIHSLGTRSFVEVRDAEFDGVRRLMKTLDTAWQPSPR